MNKNETGFLHKDETVLWQGKPKKKIFNKSDWINVPMNLLGLAIFILIIFIIVPSQVPNIPAVFYVFYIFLVVSMFYMSVGRFFVKIYVQARTEYYVTNSRVVIVKKLKNIKSSHSTSKILET